MRVLLLGASGFIGQSIVSKVPAHVKLTGTYFKNEIKNDHGHFEHLDYLSEGLDWKQIIEPYSCIIIAARANARNSNFFQMGLAFGYLFWSLVLISPSSAKWVLKECSKIVPKRVP